MWFSLKAFQVITYFYPGLTPTFGGAFLGLFYGIICGAICGWLFATIHKSNKKVIYIKGVFTEKSKPL